MNLNELNNMTQIEICDYINLLDRTMEDIIATAWVNGEEFEGYKYVKEETEKLDKLYDTGNDEVFKSQLEDYKNDLITKIKECALKEIQEEIISEKEGIN